MATRHGIMFGLILSALSIATAATAQEQPVITTTAGEGKQTITIDGDLFAELIHGTTDAYGEIPRPFIYPIIGPTGAEMTRHYPMREGVAGEASDHPHHRSLWFAHGAVNGVDFWTQGNGKGTIRATGVMPLSQLLGPKGGGQPGVHGYFRHETWTAPDGTDLVTNLGLVAFDVLDDGSRVIDLAQVLMPAEGVDRLLFGDTKEGTMAIRVHPALRLKGEVATGHCVNSEGDTDLDCWGKRAAWVAYWGEIDGKTVGVAIFDHPKNLRHPCWWHARDYGLVAANPFGAHDFEGAPPGTGDYVLEKDQTLRLQYRFVFFEGTAEQADVAGKFAQWVEDTTPEQGQGAE